MSDKQKGRHEMKNNHISTERRIVKYAVLRAERDALRVQVRDLCGHVDVLIGLARGLEEDDPWYFEQRDGEKIIADALEALRQAREAVQG